MPRQRRRSKEEEDRFPRLHVRRGRDEDSPVRLTVRLGLEDLEYHVRELAGTGFAISPLRPLAPGSIVHVTFQIPAGLSISIRAIARRWQGRSGQQWFDFTDVDREVINLLLLAAESQGIH